jgi:hypothetical protein
MDSEIANEIRRFNVLMEDQNGKLGAILEGQKDQATRMDMHRIEQHLDILESDVAVIKAAVSATNRDLNNHKGLPAHVAHGRA